MVIQSGKIYLTSICTVKVLHRMNYTRFIRLWRPYIWIWIECEDWVFYKNFLIQSQNCYVREKIMKILEFFLHFCPPFFLFLFIFHPRAMPNLENIYPYNRMIEKASVAYSILLICCYIYLIHEGSLLLRYIRFSVNCPDPCSGS